MFEPVTIVWQGKPVLIPASRILGAIAAVEEVMTFNELADFSRRQAYPTAHIARAFGVLLRYAGEPVEDATVYAGLFGDPASAFDAGHAMQTLMLMMVPPHLRNGEKMPAPVTPPGGQAPGNRKAAGKSGSSGATTTRSSRKGGARR